MDPAFTLTRDAAPDGGARWRLAGQVTLADGASLWQQFGAVLRDTGAVQVDVTDVERLDGGGAALLAAAAAAHGRAGGELTFVGARPETKRLLELYDCSRSQTCGRGQPATPGVLDEVGEFTLATAASARAILAFIGDLTVSTLQAIKNPRSVHYGQLAQLIERAGADGLPIIMLINFLVGAILGLQGAIQLHRFGADQFLANLVGLSIVRELGPLMTAILVTGRSGAAYAAELGTMTVNEEVDALRTLGQDPQRFLVFPRVLALVLVVPLLTVVANLMGSIGGLTIAMSYLSQPAVVYLQALERAVDLGDVGTGLLKSVFFAATIGLIACQRGLSTRGGAAGVGRSTTSAVVVVLFALVGLDAVFTYLFSLLDW